MNAAIDIIRQAAMPLDAIAIDAVIESVADAEVVLIGEASHGAHEFYQYRADLTAGSASPVMTSPRVTTLRDTVRSACGCSSAGSI